ncbi:MAG: UDP-N-acetylglucosamine--N-acetylmuramyl-(pentapeptide) pyrophosphoryl-undecaprenol N-acetylglucosamine transferase [uncultured Lysobacter sp.]|uniref:UDP-N-acetylglucosamine--N-acetylmuramyl-(pentapeptide) pyrophosphoryl-undecaprenol N-acetylglucosamine transferase n=1 Tax=uncultured Lysobacter sp. TaxID=271060 RepID=A0A6J4KR34_9GAMM|nr:MAG: UDP-N-acetylglucosamine--N-acetylmuramyl-(pentapeptide) pyrophosphoryl-undecaprenol N-acetylglucosamine transferase [uncultured Lysobacter sp.]
MMTSAASAARPVLILAGGTGGHIFPGLAVARALRERGVPVRWLGAEGGMETRLVPAHGIDIDTIQVRGVRGKGLATLLGAPFKVLNAVRAAQAVLARIRPGAVVSFGGFAAGPGGLAAKLAGIPLIVHEQNRAPGMTNRVLARVAARVLTGFPDSFPQAREEVVGNPVRAEIAALAPPQARFADRSGALRILVLGGSQGARALNAAVPRALAALPATIAYEVRHQSGERLHDDAMRAYTAAGITASIEPFMADMAAAYAWADLVICRAGALTLAELCAAGVGSVLVPFPQAVDDHQTKNARYLVDRGAALLLPQHEDLAAQLAITLQSLADRTKLLALAQSARAIARPDAAQRVADIVIETAAAQSARQEPSA